MIGPSSVNSDRARAALYLGVLVLGLGLACADGGKKIADPEPGGPPPVGSVVERLVPGRTVVGDTILVHGTGFGPDGLNAVVSFAGAGGTVQADAVAWGETEITVLVPDGAVSGTVSVRVDDVEGEGLDFSVAPVEISYEGDLLPLLHASACVDCHSGPAAESRLQLDSAANLLLGNSNNGPVVVRRDGPGSIIVRKISPNPPFGSRMPSGCTTGCLTDAQILEVSDWIDQGARDN